jgi:hypothetical protein
MATAAIVQLVCCFLHFLIRMWVQIGPRHGNHPRGDGGGRAENRGGVVCASMPRACPWPMLWEKTRPT